MNFPISFFVQGEAAPGGSKSAFPLKKNGVFIRSMIVDASGKNGKNWRNMVAFEGKRAFGSQPLWDCPIRVTFRFIRLRPAGHWTKNGALSSSARMYPTTKPDVLKLARAVEDALTGIIWIDDAQIVTETLTKRYGPKPGVEILIEEEEIEP